MKTTPTNLKSRAPGAALGKSDDSNRFLLLLGSQLGEVFGRILLEFGNALLTAELHFLALVDQYDRFAHIAKLVAGNNAGVQRIGFGGYVARACIGVHFPVLVRGTAVEFGRVSSSIRVMIVTFVGILRATCEKEA